MRHSVNAHLPRLPVTPILAFLLTLSGCGGGEPAAQADLTQATPVVMAHMQAQALDQSLKGDVIWVNADCCGSLGASVAVGITYAKQAASNLPDSVPVFVTGADQQQIARVASRLVQCGMRQVFLVMPQRDRADGVAG